MAQGKSKIWIWVLVIALLAIAGMVIWAISSKDSNQKAADAQDVQETANDLKDPKLPPSIRDCRKDCRIICKSKYGTSAIGGLWATFTPFSKRQKCKHLCQADCLAGVDVVKNQQHY